MNVLEERETETISARDSLERRALLTCLHSDMELLELTARHHVPESALKLGGWLHFAVFHRDLERGVRRLMDDTRKFDGPFDKLEMRRERKAMLDDVIRGELMIRVPDADPEDVKANRGEMAKVDPLPGDTGYRWTHLYMPQSFTMAKVRGKERKPVSFDAGSCALWCSPLGWRVLECWHHDDPTYGLNIVIFDPWGDIHAQVAQCPVGRSWLDGELP